MKRRLFLQGLALAPPLLLTACGKELPYTATIITGIVLDENDVPIQGIKFVFGGNTGGINPKDTFYEETVSDATGHYYLEKIIPQGTVSVSLIPNLTSLTLPKYTQASYIVLCFVDGVYQTAIPFIVGEKTTLNFKIFKH